MNYTSRTSAVAAGRASRPAFDPGREAGRLTGRAALQRPAPARQPVLLPDTLTDWGMAHLFEEVYGQYYRFVHGIGWYRWAGHCWVMDVNAASVRHSAMQLAANMPAKDPRGDENLRHPDSELRRHRRRSMSAAGATALMRTAETLPSLTLDADELDADPYALCTPGGVVNLRTGGMVPASPGQFHTRSTTLTPRAMPTPRWEQFLTDTFGDGPEGREMTAYLKRLCGYSLSGDVSAQIMAFLYGGGQNGKSVLVAVLLALLGEYADSAPPNFLMASPYADHPTELADLQGRRLVVCSEINAESRFDEAKFKLLTGGDRIKARRMYENFYSFTPTHKLWLIGNHRPAVQAGGYGFWRRMRIIAFDRTVPSERVIDNLGEHLVAEEGPGILQWMIDGALEYFHHPDLNMGGPARVRQATDDYRSSEDTVGSFVAERCVLGPEFKAQQTAIRGAYEAWCKEAGMTPVAPRVLGETLRTLLGIPPGNLPKSNGRRYYPGIGLLPDGQEPVDERTRS